MKYIISLLTGFALSMVLHAQQYITEGTISYEKKVNVHRLFDDGGDWVNAWKKTTVQFHTESFELTFSGNRTLYRPSSDQPPPGIFKEFFLRNIVYTDRTSGMYAANKRVFEENFLVQDSLPAIDWKLSTDTRVIAGFECRKAVGKIFDSLVVIAFYAEEIISSGGPESFSGLPGMILGVAIPRLHTTWYATAVQLAAKKDLPVIAAPVDGKKITRTAMLQLVEKNFQAQGKNKFGLLYTWQALL